MPLKKFGPTGKAVKLGLQNLGSSEINEVIVGKHI
ncbi:hypothetical protein BH23BAC1_BH23BAC1_29170 [soil metagenome]